LNLIVKTEDLKDKLVLDKIKSELSFLFSIEDNREILDKIEIVITGEKENDEL